MGLAENGLPLEIIRTMGMRENAAKSAAVDFIDRSIDEARYDQRIVGVVFHDLCDFFPFKVDELGRRCAREDCSAFSERLESAAIPMPQHFSHFRFHKGFVAKFGIFDDVYGNVFVSFYCGLLSDIVKNKGNCGRFLFLIDEVLGRHESNRCNPGALLEFQCLIGTLKLKILKIQNGNG
jgi:hypothetical protein